MDKRDKLLIPAVMVLLIATLYSCGGGNDSQVADGGIGGTGVTQGRVSGFGSIFVNGIEFNTDMANFTVNDANGTQDDLGIGMVVRISGTRDQAAGTGEAESVEYHSLLEGVIERNDIALDNTLTIMDQIITVNLDTVYENHIDATLLADLPTNSVVEVSGFTDGAGAILATRIEVKSLGWAGDKLEVSGVVSNISGNRFQIGNLTIDASNALPIPAEGTLVEVEGNSFSGDVFEADAIEIKGDGSAVVAEDGHKVEIEGQITVALDDQDRFTLNGQVVDASSTPFSGASSTLTVGRIVEVEGVMNGEVLLAEEIELEAEESEKGEIAGIIGVGNVDVSAGTVTLLGRTIKVDNSTIMENDLENESTFTLSQLISSDYLEAKVFFDNGDLVASKLELDTPPGNHNAEIEGIPEFIDASTIRIFGITVDTSGVGYSFSPERIEVEGNFVNDVLIASRIEVEDDDD
ncbi:MAG: hypothetical protein KZQ88_02220 [Candidatus Thiodiazotropha sp. (ex Dulcina madagascariensis)]|nr:hypothetical protein [Candidatus Thiodiazotropha sp. (ex Dulcina madagascariensis)]MCU7928730.1 hypothetical protein [Candidatus Thiodiazotropha sp. (ex Dulcina madagascariensis)]